MLVHSHKLGQITFYCYPILIRINNVLDMFYGFCTFHKIETQNIKPRRKATVLQDRKVRNMRVGKLKLMKLK